MYNPLSPGTTLRDGRYKVRALHRMGGQTIVYDGVDMQTGEQIIVKQTYQGQDWSHEVLRQEAELLGSLRHEFIPRALDCFEERDSTFLVMNHIPGTDLSDLVRRLGVPRETEQALNWAGQLLDILEHLQSQRPMVVHRDITPKNVRLKPDGSICLLDFGIAKRIDRRTLLIGGTPRYAPPEQLKDEGTDGRSDLYGLGATMYYLLTADEPPDSLTREAAVLKGQPDPLRPAHELNPGIPPLVSGVVGSALSLDPAHRPSSASVMHKWLVEAAAGVDFTEEATQTSPPRQPGREGGNATRETVGSPSETTARPEVFLRSDVTGDAEHLLRLLESGYKPEHELVQVLVEVMDSEHDRRREIIALRANFLHRKREGHAHAAIALIHKLAADAHIDSEVRLRTRQKLGRLLTDYTLTEMSRGLGRKNLQTPNQKNKHRRWLRELGIWFFRGAALSVVTQLILSLFTGGQTILDMLFSSEWGGGFAHLLLIIMGALLLIAVRYRRRHVRSGGEKPELSWRLAGFGFGMSLAIILFNDALWAFGLK